MPPHTKRYKISPRSHIFSFTQVALGGFIASCYRHRAHKHHRHLRRSLVVPVPCDWGSRTVAVAAHSHPTAADAKASPSPSSGPAGQGGRAPSPPPPPPRKTFAAVAAAAPSGDWTVDRNRRATRPPRRSRRPHRRPWTSAVSSWFTVGPQAGPPRCRGRGFFDQPGPPLGGRQWR